jgi:protein-tyrosine phosphatase
VFRHNVIDLHSHVLPGIDDGPDTLERSVVLARAAVEVGIRTMVATPHVSARCPNDPATIAALVDQVNRRLVEEGVALEVLRGAEIAITHLPDVEPEKLTQLGLGGGSWLLVEPPFALVAPGLEESVLGLQRAGHNVVLAHPERCPALQRDRRIVPSLADAGVLMSLTAGSLVGRFGGEVKRYASELVRDELVHNVTSDAHDSLRRPPGLAAEMARAGLGPLAEWLTELVPGAILSGKPIPPRPTRSPGGVQQRLRAWRARH